MNTSSLTTVRVTTLVLNSVRPDPSLPGGYVVNMFWHIVRFLEGAEYGRHRDKHDLENASGIALSCDWEQPVSAPASGHREKAFKMAPIGQFPHFQFDSGRSAFELL
jgi:hypothetical protein